MFLFKIGTHQETFGDSKMEEFEFKRRSNTLTPNEANCVRRNRMLVKYFKDQMSLYQKEYKFNDSLIKENTTYAENFKNSLLISTGSAFRDNSINTEMIMKMSQNVGKLIK